MSTHVTKNSTETQNVGKELAKKIIKNSLKKQAVVLALSGNLGAGKTTFLQGFAKGLGIKEKILSPTFVVQKRFTLKNKTFKNFYHIDCYRLKNEKDILHLGFAKMLENPENIIAIEWPGKIKKILPKKNISLKFKHIKEGQRELTLKF